MVAVFGDSSTIELIFQIKIYHRVGFTGRIKILSLVLGGGADTGSGIAECWV